MALRSDLAQRRLLRDVNWIAIDHKPNVAEPRYERKHVWRGRAFRNGNIGGYGGCGPDNHYWLHELGWIEREDGYELGAYR